jgi:hypothetical protein
MSWIQSIMFGEIGNLWQDLNGCLAMINNQIQSLKNWIYIYIYLQILYNPGVQSSYLLCVDGWEFVFIYSGCYTAKRGIRQWVYILAEGTVCIPIGQEGSTLIWTHHEGLQWFAGLCTHTCSQRGPLRDILPWLMVCYDMISECEQQNQWRPTGP